MKIELVEKKDNPLLERQEVEFSITEINVTPKKEDIRKKIAAMCNANDNLVAIEFVKNSFGSKEFNGKANIYSDADKMKKTELGYIVKRNFGGKDKKEGEKPEEKKEA